MNWRELQEEIEGLISVEMETILQEQARKCNHEKRLFPKMESTTELIALSRVDAFRRVLDMIKMEGGEDQPYLLVEQPLERTYNPQYGDDRECECGHPYYRHFDSYDENNPVGCKYCGCYTFEEKGFMSDEG